MPRCVVHRCLNLLPSPQCVVFQGENQVHTFFPSEFVDGVILVFPVQDDRAVKAGDGGVVGVPFNKLGLTASVSDTIVVVGIHSVVDVGFAVVPEGLHPVDESPECTV